MIIFDKDGFALESGFVTVFTTDENGFFLKQKKEFVSEGGSLAQYSYLEKTPVEKDGHVIKRNNAKWEYVENHKGEKWYSKETAEKVEIKEYGKVSDNLTDKKPLPYAKWDSLKNDWVIDETLVAQAFLNKKESLILLTDNKVSVLINKTKEYTMFDQQRLEAQIWTLDKSNPVPLLTALSQKIGIPLAELVKKCLEKTDQQSLAKGEIIGQEVILKRRIKAAATLDDLDKIEQDILAWK